MPYCCTLHWKYQKQTPGAGTLWKGESAFNKWIQWVPTNLLWGQIPRGGNLVDCCNLQRGYQKQTVDMDETGLSLRSGSAVLFEGGDQKQTYEKENWERFSQKKPQMQRSWVRENLTTQKLRCETDTHQMCICQKGTQSKLGPDLWVSFRCCRGGKGDEARRASGSDLYPNFWT